MKNIYKSICCFLLMALFLYPVLALADSDFDIWKKQFYQQALKSGISKKTLDKALPQMHLLERVIALDTQKPEFVSNFYDYVSSRLSPERIENGRSMAQKYQTWLSRTEDQYGVPKAYLLALWGMETNYGTFMGNVSMLDSLSSLAYHPRRRTFFTNELIAYLRIMDNEKTVAPEKGSWDGGFGNFQFMPSTFLAYAVDGDNNGRRDIVKNMPDSFASAANYLHQMGWRMDEPWGREVILPSTFKWDELHQHDSRTIADWEKMGLKPKYLDSFPDREKDITAEWYMPMGASGPVFLTYPNFKIIKRWNKLNLYAISVGLLADIIENRYDPITRPDGFIPFRTKDVICLQEKLIQEGYQTGGNDGQIGPMTRTALRHFQKDNGLVPDGYPNHELLKKMGCYDE